MSEDVCITRRYADREGPVPLHLYRWWLAGDIEPSYCVSAYRPKGAASLAASYDNNAAPGNGLADGTYDATPIDPPAWTAATGWTFNGLGDRLRTGIIPADLNYSALVQFSGAPAGAGFYVLLGAFDGGGNYFLLRPQGTARMYAHGAGFMAVVAATAQGNLGMAGMDGYWNGIDEANIVLGGAATTVEIYIGSIHTGGGVTGQYFSGTIEAMAIYSAVLTPAQMLAVATAMAAL